jgi:hypothetical protein
VVVAELRAAGAGTGLPSWVGLGLVLFATAPGSPHGWPATTVKVLVVIAALIRTA